MSLVAVALGGIATVAGPAAPAYADGFTFNANLPVSSSPGYAAVTGVPITIAGCGTIHLDLGVHTNSASYTQVVVASTLVHYYTGPNAEEFYDEILTPTGKTVLYTSRYAYVYANSNNLFRTPGPTTTVAMNGVRHLIFHVEGSMDGGTCEYSINMNVTLT